MSESNSCSMTWSSSSREPSRLTIECGSGITIRRDVSPPGCCPADPVSLGFFFNTPASSRLPSSRRPRHPPAAEYVRVRVIDGLAGVTACIEDNAVTGLRNALGLGYLVRLSCYLGHQPVLRVGEACQVRIVRLGNHQDVNRRLRIDVTKCERALGFEHPRCRDLPGRDPAE